MTQPATHVVYLSSEGCEALASTPPGEMPMLFSWHFFVAPVDAMPPQGVAELHRFALALPDRALATGIAVAALDRKIEQVYTSAQEQVNQLRATRETLLALEAPQ